MFKKTDPYSFRKFCDLQAPDSNGKVVPVGHMISEFQVTSTDDVQLFDATAITKARSRSYILNVTQRIKITNPAGSIVGPEIEDPYAFSNYPVLIDTNLSITPTKGLNFELLDYSPKTINSKIQNSGSNSDSTGSTKGSNTSSTVGSSTAQSNSYGGSVSLEGASANYEHSSTVTNDDSSTTGKESSNSNNNELSSSDSMSIKDWGAYAYLDPNSGCPSWRFGQEYPWDAIIHSKEMVSTQPNPFNKNQVPINIPDDESSRLVSATSFLLDNTKYMVNPPSQLSLFGVNFVMKASWLITLDDNSFSGPLSLTQEIEYFTGSHSIPFGETTLQVGVYIDQNPLTVSAISPSSLGISLDLPLMSLDPLEMMNKNGIVGFSKNKFVVLPQTNTPFKINSIGNTVMLQDTTVLNPATNSYSFGYDSTGFFATLSQNKQPLTMTMYFKVIDITNDYVLVIKHWITNTAVKLSIVINGDTSNSVTKYVSAMEGDGGENNLMSIHLRNQDFASVDYNDYLQLGLNSVEITITPVDDQYSTDCRYYIKAIAVEKS